ncbi:hypothetical protein WBN73_06520 [Paenarthrobacter sp. CCNWLY172]|uniref:hypothetical protein n=1 Tax=Micrococcaceae TaxID=1268 RepID=UPI001A99A404|nr:hypothetical protein [Arthrobacter sp. D5-1]
MDSNLGKMLLLEFFGVGVEVTCTAADFEDLEFLYRKFVSPSASPEVSVHLQCLDWPERGFFQSLLSKDGLRKRITICRDGLPPEVSEFTSWSTVPSPLPPFLHSRLWGRLASHPGAIVRLPDDRVLAIIGDHYVGKTSTMLELCRRGSKLVSDSLMIFEAANSAAQTFQMPLGFRRSTLVELIPSLPSFDHRLSVSPDTGLVALVHPEDILGESNSPGGCVDLVLVLSKTGGEMVIESVSTPKLGWFSGAPAELLESLLPAEAIAVRYPDGTSTECIANFIEMELMR